MLSTSIRGGVSDHHTISPSPHPKQLSFLWSLLTTSEGFWEPMTPTQTDAGGVVAGQVGPAFQDSWEEFSLSGQQARLATQRPSSALQVQSPPPPRQPSASSLGQVSVGTCAGNG